MGATMTDHTPDVADLPAELEQLRELAAAVGSKYEVQPGVWLARHRLEAAARRWLDTNGDGGELKQAEASVIDLQHASRFNVAELQAISDALGK